MIENVNSPESVPTKKEVNELIQRVSVLEDLLCVSKEYSPLKKLPCSWESAAVLFIR